MYWLIRDVWPEGLCNWEVRGSQNLWAARTWSGEVSFQGGRLRASQPSLRLTTGQHSGCLLRRVRRTSIQGRARELAGSRPLRSWGGCFRGVSARQLRGATAPEGGCTACVCFISLS